MRKLVEASFVSLDGVVEGAERWALPYFANEENKQDSLEKLMECDAFFLGRRTFEMLEYAASGAKGDPYYDRVRAMPKLVASTTLREPSQNTRCSEATSPGRSPRSSRDPERPSCATAMVVWTRRWSSTSSSTSFSLQSFP